MRILNGKMDRPRRYNDYDDDDDDSDGYVDSLGSGFDGPYMKTDSDYAGLLMEDSSADDDDDASVNN